MTTQYFKDSSFLRKNKILYQKDLERLNSFEYIYTQLRRKENRVYTDEIVESLPVIKGNHLSNDPFLKKEWQIRTRSLKKLVNYFKKKKPMSLLELGCGNGWLSHHLAVSFPHGNILAMDINETELLQGQRVFGRLYPNLTFIRADIFSCDLGNQKFDFIILAGTIQYFPDLNELIDKLLQLLSPYGEVHILDSPFYSPNELDGARRRSEDYFRELGYPEMNSRYHHHSWKELEGYNYKILYNPFSFLNKLYQKINNDSPFPWVTIKSKALLHDLKSL
ncbi:MAG: class I SAM-dependent methyltransferase [Bacteroidetes bacterium]|nr:class I SAM-dependent methyltransferase [Bacteroidota bacterium]MBI3482300.1 class I SAM-dependent methyltransferase [Bacteroidota bacterium]